MGVTALSGKIPKSPGSVVRTLQKRATALPIRIVMGNKCRWSDVRKSNLAICGTATVSYTHLTLPTILLV